jgi:hypothetical protein
VSILLTTDGGATWPITLAGIAASSKSTNVLVPTLGSPTTSAQVRLSWTNAPQGFSGESVSAGLFRIEPPFLTVTNPDGGNLWTIGTRRSINWSNNLGDLEKVLIELSQDDGATYPIVVVFACLRRQDCRTGSAHQVRDRGTGGRALHKSTSCDTIIHGDEPPIFAYPRSTRFAIQALRP